MAQEAAKKIDKRIMSHPSSSSCSLLDQKAHQIVNKLLDELDRDNEDYDKSTQRGRTQGAELPGQYPNNQLLTCNYRWCQFILSLFNN